MHLRFAAAALAAVCLSLSVAAQACPRERTRHVPAEVFTGPLQSCGGFNYQVGGVQVGTPKNGCPLFVVFTPPHEVAEKSAEETRVVPAGPPSPITMATFVCTTDWFLIIPVGSVCALDQTVNIGTVQRLTTVSCGDGPPPVDD